MPRYSYARFGYASPPELSGRRSPSRYPVVIVGAGPTGLALAIDLALHGVSSVVLDDNDVVSVGSRAICWAKRTLEIFDRLGIGERMVAKGVTWKVGRLFHRDREVWNFDLLPEPGHRMPAFVNLQQYWVEHYLVERARDFPDLIDLRFRNRVVGVGKLDDGASLTVETPDGSYRLEADWLVACDGANSFVRGALGLDFTGRLFEERFLIADVEMKADFPPERWFWFEPPFHAGGSALLHKQPDDIWRIDLQLGPDADPEVEKQPHNVIPRIEKVVGHGDFELDWVSVYTFQCRRLERFVHDRVIFVGDAAHVVSPFGARGGNGGIQDADNLGWKLAAVVQGQEGPGLIASYDRERAAAADENIANSARATTFMTPKSQMERALRDAVLDLAKDFAFARPLVNSGRLSVPATLDGGPLNGADHPGLPPRTRPGSPALDAPLGDGWLLARLGGRFQLVVIETEGPDLGAIGTQVETIRLSCGMDATGALRQRYLGNACRAVYLLRPDQHVAARWIDGDADDIRAALERAMGNA